MILNRVKLEHGVIFIKYLASVVLLIFPWKALIQNKMVLPASNTLKDVEPLENDLEKIFSESI